MVHSPDHPGKWAAVSVKRVLENQVYIGTMVQGKEEKVNYKLIIDVKFFQIFKNTGIRGHQFQPDPDFFKNNLFQLFFPDAVPASPMEYKKSLGMKYYTGFGGDSPGKWAAVLKTICFSCSSRMLCLLHPKDLFFVWQM